MATRMQQRRGTAAQWTAANPVLAAGEIGFETDTNKFKMGNGSSAWTALTYFANAAELAAIIDSAPETLNTLNELAAAIQDDPAFFTTVAANLEAHRTATGVHGVADMTLLQTATQVSTSISTHNSDTTDVHGIANTANLATTGDITTHNSDTTNVHGIADTSGLAYAATVATDISSAIGVHSNDTTNVHGIADTAGLAYAATVATDISTAVSTHASDTTDVHGIANTALLALSSTVATDISSAIGTHSSDTTNVHGIADTSVLATTGDITTHNDDTTNVHGIANTALLVTQDDLTDAISAAETDFSTYGGTGIDWNAVDTRFDIDSTVATKTYADNAVSTHDSDTTNVHGIANTALLATTADVAAVTKTTLGLGNVDNTADTAKPVSTAQSSAIATAKAEAIADATSQVNALLTGAPAALNTLDELAAALGDDANFAASVTTSLGLKVDSLTPISQKTASYTLSSLTERDDLIEMGSGSALTLTIPTDATLNFPIGTSIDILQTGAGQVTIAPVSGTVTVNATPGLKLRTTWSSCTLFKRAANTWVVYGDLTA